MLRRVLSTAISCADRKSEFIVMVEELRLLRLREFVGGCRAWCEGGMSAYLRRLTLDLSRTRERSVDFTHDCDLSLPFHRIYALAFGVGLSCALR